MRWESTSNLGPRTRNLPVGSAPTAHSSSTRPKSPSLAVPTSANPRCSTRSPAPPRHRLAHRRHHPRRRRRGRHPRRPRLPLRRHRRNPPQGQDPVLWPRSSPSSWPASTSKPPTSASSSSTPPKASPPLDANIGGYAHESGRSVIIVVNKWDLVTHPPTIAIPTASAVKPRLSLSSQQHRGGIAYCHRQTAGPPTPSSSSSRSATISSTSTTPRLSLSPPPPATASRSCSRKSNSSPASAASASPPAR